MPENVIITNHRSPGDYIAMSAAIRDIQLAYPGRFNFKVRCPQPAVFNNNPYLTNFSDTKARVLEGRYDRGPYSIHKSNQGQFHFLWGFLGDMNIQLKTNAVLTELRPDLHLTEEEKNTPLVKKPYWVFASGGKTDFTAKWWDFTYWKDVVDSMKGWTTLVQVGGGSHVHPKIDGTLDLVGKTSFRDLMRLIYHSEGVLCIVTCLMHIAAAFNKPCVVVAGGREHWWWEAYNHENRLVNLRRGTPAWSPPAADSYVPHRFLHTIGGLSCCSTGGCWKVGVQGTNKLCSKIVYQNGKPLPKCMETIKPSDVLREVEWYYKEGILVRDKESLFIPPTEIELPPKPSRQNRHDIIGADDSRWSIWIADEVRIKGKDWMYNLKALSNGKTALGIVYKNKEFYLDKRFFMVPTDVLDALDTKSDSFGSALFRALKERAIPIRDIGELVEFI